MGKKIKAVLLFLVTLGVVFRMFGPDKLPSCDDKKVDSILYLTTSKYVHKKGGMQPEVTLKEQIGGDSKTRQCSGRLSYIDRYGEPAGKVIDYTIKWADDDHKKFAVRVTN